MDEVTLAYCKDRFQREPRVFAADPDAVYDETSKLIYPLCAQRCVPAFARKYPHH